jgi:hypothetical protein
MLAIMGGAIWSKPGQRVTGYLIITGILWWGGFWAPLTRMFG